MSGARIASTADAGRKKRTEAFSVLFARSIARKGMNVGWMQTGSVLTGNGRKTGEMGLTIQANHDMVCDTKNKGGVQK